MIFISNICLQTKSVINTDISLNYICFCFWLNHEASVKLERLEKIILGDIKNLVCGSLGGFGAWIGEVDICSSVCVLQPETAPSLCKHFFFIWVNTFYTHKHSLLPPTPLLKHPRIRKTNNTKQCLDASFPPTSTSSIRDASSIRHFSKPHIAGQFPCLHISGLYWFVSRLLGS